MRRLLRPGILPLLVFTTRRGRTYLRRGVLPWFVLMTLPFTLPLAAWIIVRLLPYVIALLGLILLLKLNQPTSFLGSLVRRRWPF